MRKGCALRSQTKRVGSAAARQLHKYIQSLPIWYVFRAGVSDGRCRDPTTQYGYLVVHVDRLHTLGASVNTTIEPHIGRPGPP